MVIIQVALKFNLSYDVLLYFCVSDVFLGHLFYDANKTDMFLLSQKDITECAFA
jgi:hypothetical protein